MSIFQLQNQFFNCRRRGFPGRLSGFPFKLPSHVSLSSFPLKFPSQVSLFFVNFGGCRWIFGEFWWIWWIWVDFVTFPSLRAHPSIRKCKMSLFWGGILGMPQMKRISIDILPKSASKSCNVIIFGHFGSLFGLILL